MEIIKTLKISDIPISKEKISKERIAFRKSIATISDGEALKVKLEKRSDARKLKIWTTKDFKHTQYKVTSRIEQEVLYAYVYKIG